MALALYLDDCAYSHILRDLLTQAGHQVVVPADAGLAGEDDPTHFAYAVAHGLILLTKNPRDFVLLHEACLAQQQHHPGLFVVYQDNDRSRDMKAADIVRSVANVESLGQPLADALVVLNEYRW
jgi:hypothetical protein